MLAFSPVPVFLPFHLRCLVARCCRKPKFLWRSSYSSHHFAFSLEPHPGRLVTDGKQPIAPARNQSLRITGGRATLETALEQSDAPSSGLASTRESFLVERKLPTLFRGRSSSEVRRRRLGLFPIPRESRQVQPTHISCRYSRRITLDARE
jgi:hypothetical protein